MKIAQIRFADGNKYQIYKNKTRKIEEENIINKKEDK